VSPPASASGLRQHRDVHRPGARAGYPLPETLGRLLGEDPRRPRVDVHRIVPERLRGASDQVLRTRAGWQSEREREQENRKACHPV